MPLRLALGRLIPHKAILMKMRLEMLLSNVVFQEVNFSSQQKYGLITMGMKSAKNPLWNHYKN